MREGHPLRAWSARAELPAAEVDDYRIDLIEDAVRGEDEARVLQSLAWAGALPDGGVLDALAGERLLEVVALFLRLARRGWPRNAGGSMVWAVRNAPSEGAAALAWERSQRDGAGSDAQEAEFERQLALRGLARPAPLEAKGTPARTGPPALEFSEAPPPGWDKAVQGGHYHE